MSTEKEKIDYHYGFYGVMRCKYECGFSREELEFRQEVELGARPLRTDAIFVIYLEVNPFSDVLGGRFDKRNVIEYKGPDDSLSIDGISKVLGYAFDYKSGGRTVNEIPFEEISVFIFCHMYPREAFATLERMGFSVLEAGPGIYCVDWIPYLSVHVILIPELPEGYEELKILAPGAKEEDVLKVLADANNHQDQGYLENIKAVLRISMAANPELYEEIREEGIMVDMFERIFSKELKAERTEGRAEGRVEGRLEGALNMLFSLVNDGLLSLDAASAKAGMSLTEFQQQMKGWSKEALPTP